MDARIGEESANDRARRSRTSRVVLVILSVYGDISHSDGVLVPIPEIPNTKLDFTRRAHSAWRTRYTPSCYEVGIMRPMYRVLSDRRVLFSSHPPQLLPRSSPPPYFRQASHHGSPQ